MTSLKLTNENGSYEVAVNEDGMTIGNLFEFVIIPLLLAAGYSSGLIEEYLGEN